MTWNAGTATDYIDLLNQIVPILTGDHLASITLNAAGTGYTPGDILTLDNTGATFTLTAQLEVVTVTGGGGTGPIGAVRIYRGGAYTVQPSTLVANAVTGGTGSGATVDLTFGVLGWTVLTRQSRAVLIAPTIATAGTGYNIGDVLTLVGGVQTSQGGSPATFTVATLTGGAGSGVASVTVTTQGDYEVFPTNPVLTTVSPSGGTGCELTVNFEDTTGDTIIVLEGDAGAAVDPIVGIKTYSSETDETGANTVYNWALFGMTAWANNLPLHQQANISPGFNTSTNNGSITASTTGDGAFVPLKDADAFNIDWRMRATGRSFIVEARVATASTVHYAVAAGGLLNPFGVTVELPFPAFVAGTSDRKRVWYGDTSSIFGGLSSVIRRANGPMFVWAPEGQWLEAKNALITANQDTTPSFNAANTAPRVQVWPLGEQNAHQTIADQIWTPASTIGFDMARLTLATGAVEMYRTPNTGEDQFELLPITVAQADTTSDNYRTFGAIDGAFWFHVADSGASSLDRFFNTAGEALTIFQNGTRVGPIDFMCIRED